MCAFRSLFAGRLLKLRSRREEREPSRRETRWWLKPADSAHFPPAAAACVQLLYYLRVDIRLLFFFPFWILSPPLPISPLCAFLTPFPRIRPTPTPPALLSISNCFFSLDLSFLRNDEFRLFAFLLSIFPYTLPPHPFAHSPFHLDLLPFSILSRPSRT